MITAETSYFLGTTTKTPFLIIGKGLHAKQICKTLLNTKILQIKNVQPVTRGLKHRFCTAFRQVSRLKDLCIGHLPSFPVITRLLLPNYGDEFAQDLHLFPFSPKPVFYKTASTPDYYIFNCS